MMGCMCVSGSVPDASTSKVTEVLHKCSVNLFYFIQFYIEVIFIISSFFIDDFVVNLSSPSRDIKR